MTLIVMPGLVPGISGASGAAMDCRVKPGHDEGYPWVVRFRIWYKYRPRKPASDPGDLAHFVKADLPTLDHAFGSWEKAHAKFAPIAAFRSNLSRPLMRGKG